MSGTSAKLRDFLSGEFKAYIKDSNKKSLVRQVSEMKALYGRYGVFPYHYIKHGLYSKSCVEDVANFIPPKLVTKYCDKVNPVSAWPNVIDKVRFATLMQENGLRTAPNVAVMFPNGAISADGKEITFAALLDRIKSLRNGRAFIKPSNGGQAVGTFIVTVQDDHMVVAKNAYDADALTHFLFQSGAYESYLVQPVIHQHEALMRLNEYAVSTVRIDTLCLNDQVEHSRALLKVGYTEAPVDNWRYGGLIIKVDLATGTLDDFGKIKAKFGGGMVTEHPRTGFHFGGMVLPYWPELLKMIEDAARRLRPLVSLGWDVAIAEDGPVLIEANQDFDAFMLQEGGGSLRNTPLGREVLRER